MSKKRTEYDHPWKEAISLYFREFMAFFFREIESQIDWDKGYEFLDKEFQQIVRDAQLGERKADKLVKVWRSSGEEVWVLIHIEVQSQYQSNFAERMYVYNYRIFDKYKRNVVSLAILADEQPNWRPSTYHSELWGCKIELTFPIVKLLDYQRQNGLLENDNNPFAVIVAAHLRTQQTKKDTSSRYQAKLSIAKSLYQRGYSRQDIRELFRLIDWIMTLPKQYENEFIEEIFHFEEEKQMPYVTSFERIAREKGLSEGIIQKGREALIDVLDVRFNNVPEDVVELINQLQDPNHLKNLLREAITIESLAEFRDLLSQINF